MSLTLMAPSSDAGTAAGPLDEAGTKPDELGLTVGVHLADLKPVLGFVPLKEGRAAHRARSEP